MRRLLLLAVAGALAVGCGNDDDGSDGSDFVERGNAICVRNAEAFDKLSRFLDTSPKLGLARYYTGAAAAVRTSNEEFERLDPPARLEHVFRESLTSNRAGAAEYQEVALALRQSDDPIRTLQRHLRALVRRSELGQRQAKALGFEKCLTHPEISVIK